MGAGVLNVLWQVASRFVIRRPSPWTEELARFLLMWLGLLGAAYVSGRKMHLAIDIVVRGLRGRARIVAEGAVDLLTALFAGLVLVAGGLRLVSLTLALGQTSAALGLPMGAIYMVLPLSGLIMAAYALRSFVRRLSGSGRSQSESPGSEAIGPERETPSPTTGRGAEAENQPPERSKHDLERAAEPAMAIQEQRESSWTR